MDPVPNNRARIFGGERQRVLQAGLDVEVAGEGGFGALLAPRKRAAGFCQGRAQRVTSKGRGTMCSQEGRGLAELMVPIPFIFKNCRNLAVTLFTSVPSDSSLPEETAL